jgi:ATP-binding cassette subfamily B protein
MSAAPAQPSQSGRGEMTNGQLIRRMLGLSWQHRYGCVKVVGITLGQRLLEIGGLSFIGLAIDYFKSIVVADADPPKWPLGLAPPESWSAMTVIYTIGLAIVLFALVRGIISYLGIVATADLVNRQIVVSLRAAVYDKMQRLSFRFFDANASGSLINRVTSDVQRVRMFIEGVVVTAIGLMLTLVVYVSYMLSLHVWLTLACLVTAPLLWSLAVWFSRVVRPAYMHNRRLVDHMILKLQENLQGVRVIKGFARQSQEIDRFSKANGAVRDQKQWIILRHSLFIPGIHLLTHTNMVILLGYGGYLALQGQITIGVLYIFVSCLRALSDQVGQIVQITNSMQESLVSAQRVFEVLDEPMEITSPADPVRLPMPQGRVTFDHVSFGYKEDDLVLEDIDLDVEPGQCVAILGATGSGKSTLLSLIPRFYDPTRGRVLIDDIDARKLQMDDLRHSVGLVFQESFLFSNTVAANIAFGHPQATQEQVEKAAKIAQAHHFIMRDLSNGYDTVLGEGGLSLSGGQRQRLAIARAILLEPAILLLDDPTAAIDPETEHEIMAAMENAMRGRTTFVVAHRLSTLRRADLVIVLDKGRIVQVGRHEDLMEKTGAYRAAANLQVADSESRRLLGVSEEVSR